MLYSIAAASPKRRGIPTFGWRRPRFHPWVPNFCEGSRGCFPLRISFPHFFGRPKKWGRRRHKAFLRGFKMRFFAALRMTGTRIVQIPRAANSRPNGIGANPRATASPYTAARKIRKASTRIQFLTELAKNIKKAIEIFEQKRYSMYKSQFVHFLEEPSDDH